MNFNNNACKKYRFIAVLFAFACLVPLNITTRVILPPKLCVQCHMMRPEYYTWQVSSHAGVSCVSCHIAPGTKNVIKSYGEIFKNIYVLVEKTYVSPIKMLKPSSDASCEQCHDMSEGAKTKSGNLNVNHSIHKMNQIRCFKCHKGLTHGNIVDRDLTYENEYESWDVSRALSEMREARHTNPAMEACMDCHQVREISRECKTCHPKGNTRADHKENDFNDKKHGLLAVKDIKVCHSCHKYMTENTIEGIGEFKAYEDFLRQGKSKPVITVEYYARSNEYCKECHGKRPKSHDADRFMKVHGNMAKVKDSGCMTCHDNQPGQALRSAEVNAVNTLNTGARERSPVAQLNRASIKSPVTTVTCSQCHPSPHTQSVQWRKGYHPVQIGPKPKINTSCFNCHIEAACMKCHGGSKYVPKIYPKKSNTAQRAE